VLELVPGLLDGVVLADDPVVLLGPDIALFNFTVPLASRQWVAADGLGAPGWRLVAESSFGHSPKGHWTLGTVLLLRASST